MNECTINRFELILHCLSSNRFKNDKKVMCLKRCDAWTSFAPLSSLVTIPSSVIILLIHEHAPFNEDHCPVTIPGYDHPSKTIPYTRILQHSTDSLEKIQKPFPIIDFHQFLIGNAHDKQLVGEELLNAFKNFGFLYLANHGIPKDQLNQVFGQSKRFFDLPMAEKDKLSWKSPEANRGYVAPGLYPFHSTGHGSFSSHAILNSFGNRS